MNRRQFLSGVCAGTALLAGCSTNPGHSSQQVTIPALSIKNLDTRPATASVVVSDGESEVYLWESVELDGLEEDSGLVDTHEFEAGWTEPRDYELLIKWPEANEIRSNRVADLPNINECAPLEIALNESIQLSLRLDACPPTENT